MSLKAYDLVWVEGKSAAWRYPGEIEELKSFAPPVEEQPFDRFFKKPVQAQDEPIRTAPKSQPVEAESSRFAPVASETKPAAKVIFVNMPGEDKSGGDSREQIEKKQPVREKPVTREIPAAKEPAYKEPVQKSFAQSLPTAVTAVDDNVVTPSEQLKKLYAQKEARERKGRSPKFNQILKPIGIGFGLVALLAAGIFIGLSINKRGLNSTDKNTGKEQTGALEQQSSIPTRTIPARSTFEISPADKNSTGDISTNENSSANVADEKTLEERRKLKAAKKRIADSLNALKAAPKIDSSAFTAERETVKKPTEAQLEKESIKNNIADYVALSASKFNVGTFGGISDLQLTVSNTSPFTLDLVVVEVQYIQSNKKIFKTENLYYHNVNAGAAIMEEAPKSSRGVKVKYRITIISSKNLGISYTEL